MIPNDSKLKDQTTEKSSQKVEVKPAAVPEKKDINTNNSGDVKKSV